MSDQVSMYFETLGELEEKDQRRQCRAKYQHILEHLEEIDQILTDLQPPMQSHPE